MRTLKADMIVGRTIVAKLLMDFHHPIHTYFIKSLFLSLRVPNASEALSKWADLDLKSPSSRVLQPLSTPSSKNPKSKDSEKT